MPKGNVLLYEFSFCMTIEYETSLVCKSFVLVCKTPPADPYFAHDLTGTFMQII